VDKQPVKVSLGVTESLCPHCLRRIPAERIAVDDEVYLAKICPAHGEYRTVIWRGQPAYRSWGVTRLPSQPPVCSASVNRGCPFDCGLCPAHRQHTCCVLLEVTGRCNLSCPVCFAESGDRGEDPDIRTIEAWYRMLLASGGPYNIQLSGGEPTLRDDLPEIVALGRSLGFSFIQLNTNGLRLAEDPGYGQRLKQAGLGCVFLQFDGTCDTIYQKIRGKALLAVKRAAIACCAEQQLGVVLVPTLVPGVNTQDIGAMIALAIELMPTVRGVHFQPISYFGRYPQEPADSCRITIPEVITAIEHQTGDKVKAQDFRPPGAENAYCSFLGNFVVMADGELKAWTKAGQSDCGCQPQTAADGVSKARAFVARHWSAAPGGGLTAGMAPPVQVDGGVNLDSLDAFLSRVEQYSLCISGMAFQDAWNVDLERLRDCFLHVVGPDGSIIPFCAYNLTDRQGRSLYRPQRGCRQP
jgi:7,8-dihydro-6-hydroxymethylpterin dimethyltransferase